MFNKVVRWHRIGEVENVYVAYNFSHFDIFLPKLIKIDWWKFDKVLTKTKMLFFLIHGLVFF